MNKLNFTITFCSFFMAFPIMAKAQVYTLQPSVSSSLGNAAGAALSGHYNGPTTTMYFGNNASMYRNNQVYGGPDYVASFFGQNHSNNSQNNILEKQKQEDENDEKADDHELNQSKIELEKAKKEQMSLNSPFKENKKHEEKQKESNQNQTKQTSYYIDKNIPLSVIGKAKTLDGISMMIGNTLVILHGVIAPGNGQMCNGEGIQYECGNKATENLSELVNGKTVACNGWGNYGICVSQDDGTNINNYVLRQGIAKPE